MHDPADLKAKRVLITGAASGIGRAVAEHFIRAGACVGVVDADDAVHQLNTEGALCWQADVSDARAVERTVDDAHTQLGRLDVLAHMAGIMRGQAVPLVELPDPLWDDVIRVNLTGSYLVAKHVARHMIAAGRGVIVLAASGAGVVAPSGSVAYGASKGGVYGLSLTLAQELRPKGIRVHVVCPGLVATPLLDRSIAEGKQRDPDRYTSDRLHVVSPDAIAEIVAFLASDQASHVRGAVFTD
jgi:NAD(P)-dependent dehydrogenase (short-subunit alcohol dehydrogenase family)